MRRRREGDRTRDHTHIPYCFSEEIMIKSLRRRRREGDHTKTVLKYLIGFRSKTFVFLNV